MKSFLLILLATFVSALSLTASDGYDIEFQVNGISGDDAILAYYYMDKKYIKDTIRFDDKGHASIEGEHDIPTGVYLLAFPSRQLRYFELILGEEKSFKIQTDTADFIGNMNITGSVENQLLYDNINFMVTQGRLSEKLRNDLSGLEEDTKEYKNIIKKLENLEEAISDHRNRIMKDHPDAYYTAVIRAMTDVEMVENPDPSDSSYAYRFYQEHYFDNIDFKDNRLARTPFLVGRILGFFDHYTLPEPDSINAAAERVIERSRVNDEMFQLCLVSIFNKYARSKIMAHELVYVNLAKKYYISGVADWITEEQKQTFTERITKMEPTLLGKKAPEIIISDLEGRTRKLSEITGSNEYTVLIFWNSGCGHCKKEMPHLKAVYDTILSPLADMEVFAISTELETDEWTKFITENELITEGWTHAHDPFGRNPMRVLYNIETTPVVIVLDQDQKIMAKRISVDDIAGMIEFDQRIKSNRLKK